MSMLYLITFRDKDLVIDKLGVPLGEVVKVLDHDGPQEVEVAHHQGRLAEDVASVQLKGSKKKLK